MKSLLCIAMLMATTMFASGVTKLNSTALNKFVSFIKADDVKGFVAWLKEDGIDVNAVVDADGFNTSLLHNAALYGSVRFVDQLITAGAEVESTNDLKLTPIDIAEACDRHAVVVRLLSAGAIALADMDAVADKSALAMRQAGYERFMLALSPIFASASKSNYRTVFSDWLYRGLSNVSLLASLEKHRRGTALFHNYAGRTQLQEAVVKQKSALVKLLLAGRQYKSIIYERDANDWQAVHHAAFYNSIQELELLHAKGANINAEVTGSKHTPLAIAVLRGNSDMVAHLLARGANSLHVDHLDRDALQLAVHAGRVEIAAMLLDHGMPASSIANARELAVSRLAAPRAARYQRLVELLDTAQPAAPIAYDEEGFTELQSAVIAMDSGLVEEISVRGDANLHATTEVGLTAKVALTAAHIAALVGYPGIMKILYAAGADFNVATPAGLTPTLLAAKHGNVAAVAYLIKINANIGAVTSAGENLLHLAVEGEHYDLVSNLVRRGIDLHHRTDKGESALDIAKRLGNDKIISVLDRTTIAFDSNGKLYIGAADKLED